MDNFVAQLKNNINIENKTVSLSKVSRYREVLSFISTASSTIKILNGCSEDGDVKFEVSIKTLGMGYDVFTKYKKDICSEFLANFIGELLIREHLDEFAKVITGLSSESYLTIVNRFEHRKFGMDIVGDKLVFVFHISLLQNILLEDLKRKMR